jgi:hypothetical protein
MSDDVRSGQSAAKRVGGVLAVVILLNVLPRLLPFPDVGLPSISIPDLPGWIDVGVDVVHTVVKVKNWVLVAVVAGVVACLAVDQFLKRRRHPE